MGKGARVPGGSTVKPINQKMTEREEFEKSELERHPGAHLFIMPEGRYRAGQYQNQHVESAWRAWQARGEEIALLREYRNAHINFNYSHGSEGGTLDELVEIERKAEERLEKAERECHQFYAKS